MTDLILTPLSDLAVANGDFLLGDCLKQSQTLLLLTDKGEWKQHPAAGVGAAHFIETHATDAFTREVREQFARDGMQVNSLRIQGTQLYIDALWK